MRQRHNILDKDFKVMMVKTHSMRPSIKKILKEQELMDTITGINTRGNQQIRGCRECISNLEDKLMETTQERLKKER